jgi:hypothetical protein
VAGSYKCTVVFIKTVKGFKLYLAKSGLACSKKYYATNRLEKKGLPMVLPNTLAYDNVIAINTISFTVLK